MRLKAGVLVESDEIGPVGAEPPVRERQHVPVLFDSDNVGVVSRPDPREGGGGFDVEDQNFRLSGCVEGDSFPVGH